MKNNNNRRKNMNNIDNKTENSDISCDALYTYFFKIEMTGNMIKETTLYMGLTKALIRKVMASLIAIYLNLKF